jgi:hypothetical protein
MDSPTIIQVCLAFAMIIALVGALWPKLACRTDIGDQNFSSRKRQTRFSNQGVRFRSAAYDRHALRVRASYDRMVGRWLHTEPLPEENSPDDQRAA